MSIFILASGDPGTVHNVGLNFERAAETAFDDLRRTGNTTYYFPITSLYGF